MAASCPHTFSLGSHNSQVLPLVTRGILPHVLKSIHKICLHSTSLYGVLKNRKGETFLVSIKLSAICGNLSLHYSCLPLLKNTSFLQFGQVENIHRYLFDKIFLVCFSPLSHRQSSTTIVYNLLIISRCILVGPLLRSKNL